MGILAILYSRAYNLFGGNEAMISIVGSYVLMAAAFWLPNAIFLLVDLTGRPHWIAKYKVQQDKNVPIDRTNVWRVMKTAMFNNLVLNALASYPIYHSQTTRGCSFAVDEVPSWLTILKIFFVSTLIQEVIFYYSHRLFHHPLLYERIHKKHHRWTAPIGIVSIYTTPFEYLTGNGLSVFVGPYLMRAHIVVFWLWYSIATVVTIIHHSGYHLPLFPSPQFHDFHHLTFKWNFGTLGVLDWLHGTDKLFRRSIQRRRHRTFCSTKTIQQLYPDRKQTEEEVKTAASAAAPQG